MNLRVIGPTRNHFSKAVYSLIVSAQSLEGDPEVVEGAEEVRVYHQRPLIVLYGFFMVFPNGLDGTDNIEGQGLVGVDAGQPLCLGYCPVQVAALVELQQSFEVGLQRGLRSRGFL